MTYVAREAVHAFHVGVYPAQHVCAFMQYTADMGDPRYLTHLEVVGVPLYDFIPFAPRGLTAQSHRHSTPGVVSLMAMVSKPLSLPRSRWWLSEIHQRICRHRIETTSSVSPMDGEEECLDSGHYSLGQSSCDDCDCIGEYTACCEHHDLEGGYMAADLDRLIGSIGCDFGADDRVVRNEKGPFRTEVW